MADIIGIVLEALKQGDILDSTDFSVQHKLEHNDVVRVLKSLEQSSVVALSELTKEEWRLTQEGEEIKTNGSHEVILFNHIPEDGKLQKEVENKHAWAFCVKKGVVEIRKTADGPRMFKKEGALWGADETQTLLQHLDVLAPSEKKDLSKRKLIEKIIIRPFKVAKGVRFGEPIKKEEPMLTKEMLARGTYSDVNFKPLNFDAVSTHPIGGHLHPLMKVRSMFRRIFLCLGYQEMPTSRFVESSFWNFDALFQPQAHPCRDMHDTFFLSDPSTTLRVPESLVQRVKEMHEHGGEGSLGWRYDWKMTEATKNIMRTHTTAISAHMLSQVKSLPAKYFSIDRVFRNETLDATHLAEFHQVEGLVVAKGLSLTHLMGVFTQFFARLGLTQLRFRPTYNPYTEPSMEILAFHPALQRWVEIGNSGVLRPEVVKPLLTIDSEDVTAIAWGLSLERPTMILYGIDNIRSLFGPRMNLSTIEQNPIGLLGCSCD
nr:phenylalanine--tRNA ligase alpha subunit [Paratrimastix eleionoma]